MSRMSNSFLQTLKQKGEQIWLTFDYRIEQSQLQRFSLAMGERNPQWQKEVPVSFLLTVGLERILMQVPFSAQIVLLGSSQIVSKASLMEGEIITVQVKIISLKKRAAQTFVKWEIEHKNCNDETVACVRQMVMVRSTA